MPLKVFLSYAREDQRVVEDLFRRLEAERFEPWMDIKKLLPGQNWEAEIDLALRDANVIVALLSPNSVTKRGFVQREANYALDNLRYKLPTDIYFIPVLIETCEVPTHLSTRQYIDINTPGAWEQLVSSLKLAASQQSIAIENGIPFGPFNVVIRQIQEVRDGQPGDRIEIEYPNFTSTTKPIPAQELSTFFEGRALTKQIENRGNPDEQNAEMFPSAGEFHTTNGYWENVQLAFSNDSIASIAIGISTYGAGAAHPNHGFETFNFVCANQIRRFSLQELFTDPHRAEERISELCLEKISREYWRRTGEAPDQQASEWISQGCRPHEDNFRDFVVNGDGLVISFAPYHVAPYALSSWNIEISFYDLLPMLDRNGPYGFIDRIGAEPG